MAFFPVITGLMVLVSVILASNADSLQGRVLDCQVTKAPGAGSDLGLPSRRGLKGARA